MSSLKKNLLLIFLLENLVVSSLFGFGSWFFYLILLVGMFFLLRRELWHRTTFNQCKILYVLSYIYIGYQFTLGYGNLDVQRIIYLFARVTTFIIIIISVTHDLNFNTYKVPLYMSLVILFVLLTGALETNDLNSGDRIKMGFGNVNLTGSLSAICLSGVMFFWNRRQRVLYIMYAILSLYALLASGSRNGILYLAIMMFVWTKLSVKRILYALIIVLTILLSINLLSIKLSGVERIIATVEGSEGTSRDTERLATMMMIAEKPITGWGFEAENEGAAAMVSELGSHNGYLEQIKFMGYPFAILWFMALLCGIIPLLKYIRSDNNALRYHLAIVLSTLATACFEGWFTGVHQINTNIFYYSLAILTVHNYRANNFTKFDVNPT